MSKQQNYLLLHFLILLTSFIPFVATQICLPAAEIIFIRANMALAILGVIIFVRKYKLYIQQKELIRLLFSGLLTGIYWVLLFFSAKISNASVALVGLATTSIWVSFIRPFFTKKQVSFIQILTGISVLVGVYIIYKSDFEYEQGLITAIAAAFFGAWVTVYNAKLVKNHQHIVITFYQMGGVILCTSLLFLVKLFNGNIDLIPNRESFIGIFSDYGLILMLAFVFSVYAYSAVIKISKVISPFTILLVANLAPIYGIVSMVLISQKDELMKTDFYMGALIIVASIFAYPLFQYIRGKELHD